MLESRTIFSFFSHTRTMGTEAIKEHSLQDQFCAHLNGRSRKKSVAAKEAQRALRVLGLTGQVNFSLKNFFKRFIYVCLCVYAFVWMYVHMHVQVPTNGRRGCWIPWIRNGMYSWAIQLVCWDLNSSFHDWSASALNHQVTLPAQGRSNLVIN